jgi:hypothetical protein
VKRHCSSSPSSNSPPNRRMFESGLKHDMDKCIHFYYADFHAALRRLLFDNSEVWRCPIHRRWHAFPACATGKRRALVQADFDRYVWKFDFWIKKSISRAGAICKEQRRNDLRFIAKTAVSKMQCARVFRCFLGANLRLQTKTAMCSSKQFLHRAHENRFHAR